MTSLFISYSRRDKPFVTRLAGALDGRYDVWVDWQDIPPSAEWWVEVVGGLEAADAFVYVISPDSVTSEVCGRELGHAIDRRKRIVPVVCRDVSAADVPERAAALNWIFLREGDDFETGVKQLVSAVEQDLEHVKTHTRLGVAASRWEGSGNDSSQLLRGAELAAAERWLVAAGDKQPAPSQLQRSYVLASRQAATRRQRTMIATVTFALLITMVLAIVALVQRSSAIHERNVALARQLDANAQSQYTKDPELSVLLAERAARVYPASSTEEALRQALGESQVRFRYTLPSPVAPDAIWSPDGSRLLVTDPGLGGWARIYAPGTAAPPVVLQGFPASAGQSGWDADGDRVILGGGHPAVFDSRSGRAIDRVPGTALFAALNRDGSRAVTVDLQSVGHVFDVNSGRQLSSFHPRYRGGATCFALSPDGSTVAQCDASSLRSLSSSLDTWDVSSGRELNSVASPTLISSVAFSPDSRRYVFTIPLAGSGGAHATASALAREAGTDGTFVYDVAGGARVAAFPEGASAAAFGPIAAVPEIAYATIGDDVVHVYSFLSHVNHSLIGSSDVVKSLAFNAAGTEVVGGSSDDTARVWDALNGGLPVETLAGHRGSVRSASFGESDTAVATASEDGTVRVWASPKPEPAASLPAGELPRGGDVTSQSLGFTQDGSQIVQASLSGEGQVLDARTLGVRARFALPSGLGFGGAGVTPDGRFVAALSGPLRRGLLTHVTAGELYAADDGRLIATLRSAAGDPILGAALDHAADRLVTVGASGAADEWDASDGKLLRHLTGSTPAAGAAFSADGSRIAIVHYPVLPRTVNYRTTFGQVTIDLWNSATGAHLRTITGDTLTPQAAGTEELAPLSAAFRPDGRLLAVAGADQGIEIYNTSTGAVIRRLGLAGASGGSFAGSLQFSRDGKLLAAGALSGAYVWRLPSFVPLALFQHVPSGSASPVLGAGSGVTVAFSDDSRYLMTSGDLALSEWDLADHQQLFHASLISRGAISPDGQELVAAGSAGIATYSCDLCGGLDHLLALAKRNTTRPLTPTELATYLGGS